MHNPTLKEVLYIIRELEHTLIKKAQSILKVGSPIYPSNLFVLGAIERTITQSRGFTAMIEMKNFPCAAAILRLQIDTAMRIYGLFLLDDPDGVCMKILGGVHMRKFKDRNGIKLTDSHLRAELSKIEPWVDEVYEQTSDFIHLSRRHLFSSSMKLDDETRTIGISVGAMGTDRTDEEYIEVASAFDLATGLAGSLCIQALKHE